MECLQEEMATAGELTRIVDRLEERVGNHITFFRWAQGFMFLWLAAGTAFLINMQRDLSVLSRPDKLSKAATTPDDPKSQAVAKQIITDAKNGPPISQSVVQQSGGKFVEAASRNRDVWPVAVELVSYRTTYNRDLLEVGTAEQIATAPDFNEGPVARFFNAPPPLPGPEFTSGGSVPIAQSALMGLLGSPYSGQSIRVIEPGGNQTQPPAGVGKQVILAEGGAILLDGMILRHVVVRKTQVFYNGGDTSMEDVIFVNCSFVLKNDPKARLFALAVLGQPQVKFQPARF